MNGEREKTTETHHIECMAVQKPFAVMAATNSQWKKKYVGDVGDFHGIIPKLVEILLSLSLSLFFLWYAILRILFIDVANVEIS